MLRLLAFTSCVKEGMLDLGEGYIYGTAASPNLDCRYETCRSAV